MTRDELLTEFDHSEDIYAALTDKLHLLIAEILQANSLNVHSITSRAKSRSSVAAKIAKSDAPKYQCLNDVTDLTGIRIITYFADDVDRVARAFHCVFVIDD